MGCLSIARVTPSIKFTSTQFYTRGRRKTLHQSKVSCPKAQSTQCPQSGQKKATLLGLDWSRKPSMRPLWLQPEAYHLEAYNSDPMLGFFSEPIKFYFLIWNIAHCTSRYRLLCGSNGGRFVLLVVCRFSTFFRAHQENQAIAFLEQLVQYQV